MEELSKEQKENYLYLFATQYDPWIKNDAFLANRFDFYYTDIDEQRDVKNIVAPKLGIEYLGSGNMKSIYEWKGIMYGEKNRCFINVVCKYLDCDPINVIFLVEPGSYYNYITDDTIDALLQDKYKDRRNFSGFSDIYTNIPYTPLDVVSRSNFKGSHFKGVNILGTDLFDSHNILLKYDYKNGTIGVEKSRYRYVGGVAELVE